MAVLNTPKIASVTVDYNSNLLYSYVYRPIVLTANQSDERTVDIDTRVDFLCTNFYGVGLETANPDNEKGFLIQFRDDQTGAFIQNRPAHSKTVLRKTDVYNPLPVPRLFVAQTSVTANVTAFLVPITIWLTLEGFKMLKTEPQNLKTMG